MVQSRSFVLTVLKRPRWSLNSLSISPVVQTGGILIRQTPVLSNGDSDEILMIRSYLFHYN